MRSKVFRLSLALGILLTCSAFADEHVSVQSCVEQISGSVSVGSVPTECHAPEVSVQQLPREVFKLNLNSHCKSLNSKSLCETLADACEKSHGKSGLKIACFTNHQGTLKNRLERPGFLASVERQSEEYAKGVVASAVEQKTCCGDSEECKSCLKSVGFRFLENYSTKASFCRALPLEPPVIECTPAGLVGHLNAQSLEREILHELGHVCENCRHYKKKSDANSDELKAIKDDLTHVLGAPLGTCIIDGVANEARLRSRGQTDIKSWLREVFADTAFYRRKTELAHWAPDCGTQVTDSHGPTDIALDCLLKNTGLSENFCK